MTARRWITLQVGGLCSDELCRINKGEQRRCNRRYLCTLSPQICLYDFGYFIVNIHDLISPETEGWKDLRRLLFSLIKEKLRAAFGANLAALQDATEQRRVKGQRSARRSQRTRVHK